MRIAAYFAAALLVAGATAVQASPGEDLVKKSGCVACHANDKKLVGPAYNEVAKKYKGDAKAAAMLPLAAEKVAAETKRIADIRSRKALRPAWLDGALRAAGVIGEGDTL